jgi:hypothetical protein
VPRRGVARSLSCPAGRPRGPRLDFSCARGREISGPVWIAIKWAVELLRKIIKRSATSAPPLAFGQCPCHNLAFRSARLRRFSAYCALVSNRRVAPTEPIAPTRASLVLTGAGGFWFVRGRHHFLVGRPRGPRDRLVCSAIQRSNSSLRNRHSLPTLKPWNFPSLTSL